MGADRGRCVVRPEASVQFDKGGGGNGRRSIHYERSCFCIMRVENLLKQPIVTTGPGQTFDENLQECSSRSIERNMTIPGGRDR
jgi:hypothetical protein